MGYRPIRTIADAQRHGFLIEITCRRCGRRALFDPSGFLIPGQFNQPIDRLAARMVCKGGVGRDDGCGSRGAYVRFVTLPVEPARLPPRPVSSPAPRGIDQDEWDKADDRGRKRLVRIARG